MKQVREGTYTCIYEDTFITDQDQLREEVLLAETRMNMGKVRFHIHDGFKPEWFQVMADPPESGKEVLGYNETWVDEDFNPDGICLCYLTDTGYWDVAKWCGIHDEWHTRPTGQDQWEKDKYKDFLLPPTHWKFKPAPPISDHTFNKL